MKKLLITFILGIFLFSFVAAQSTPTYEVDSQFNVTIICLNDGYCSASSFCNINIIDPNGLMIVQDTNMTNWNTFHTYNMSATDIGTYSVGGLCVDGSKNKEVNFDFLVTQTGAEPISSGQGMIFIAGIILILSVSVFFCYLGIRTKKGMLQISLIGFSMLIMVFGLGFILNSYEVLMGQYLTLVSNFSTIYNLFTILVGIGVFALIVYLIYIVFNMWWASRGLNDSFKDLK